MGETDHIWARAVAMMDRVDDALIAGNHEEANRLGHVRDALIAWAEDLEAGRQPKGTIQ